MTIAVSKTDLVICNRTQGELVFCFATGELKWQHPIDDSNLIQTFDPVNNFFYNMDIACYGWLKRYKIKGFEALKPGSKAKVKKKIPQLPLLFDETKGRFLESIKAVAKKEKPVEEPFNIM